MNRDLNKNERPQNGKLHYLDGMRGLMAINVILCHFSGAYYPQMSIDFYAAQRGGFLSLFATTPLYVLVSGSIAVMYFLALTGFLVGMSVFTSSALNLNGLARKCVHRYTRLLPVICVATLVTHITMTYGLQYHLRINDPLVNTAFLSSYCNFEPTWRILLNNIFVKPFLRGSDYIGPFWTIKYEFLGYIAVLLVATVLRNSRWRRLLYACVAVIAYEIADINYSILMMGLFVADLEFNQNPTIFGKFYEPILRSKIVLGALFVVGTYFSCSTTYASPFYALLFKLHGVSGALLQGIGISLFLFVAVRAKPVQKILSLKPLLYLGNCSFETYALHWPLMLSLEAGLFILLRNRLSYDAAAVLAFAITVAVIYLLSFALHRLLSLYHVFMKKRKSISAAAK